ncbi:MAG TPA: preprotein translocase subunit YajC [Alphaproteobacteria bacterium]|nr:preprotein translocase subunit YajC [Alphaproteobacteria bacterium]HNS45452.1 preprotein translocase subunit YajC [Alphaproteobacteria bacterium]
MIFTPAYAEEATTATTAVPAGSPAGTAPSESETLMMNIGMLVVLGIMFYLLLIRPQQRRFKEHANMLSQLGKGVKIVTQGGLVGTIDKEVSDHEVQVDLGNGVKVNMMRSYIIGKYEDSIPTSSPANDDKKAKKDKSAK